MTETRPKYLGHIISCSPIFLIYALSIYLWIWGLNDYYFIQDSALHLEMAYKNGFSFLRHIKLDTHPPLYYFLLKLVQVLFGSQNPFIYRCLSGISGLIAVHIAFLWGKKIGKNRNVGLFCAFFLATAPFFILQNQIIRNYSLLICILFSIFYLFDCSTNEINQFWRLVVLLILLTATHYSSVILLPTFLMVGLLKIKSLQRLQCNRLFLAISWVIFIVLNGTLSLWMIKQLGSYRYSDHHISYLKDLSVKSLNQTVPTLFNLTKCFFGKYEVWIVLGLIFLGIFKLFKNGTKENLILFCGPILTAIFCSVLNYYPLNSGRHSIYLLPVFFLPLIHALKWMSEKFSESLVLLLCLVLLTQKAEKPSIYSLSDWRQDSQNSFEIGPTFSEVNLVKDTINNQMRDGGVLFDWHLHFSLSMEKALTPDWAVFTKINRPISYCSFLNPSKLCQCLKTNSNNSALSLLIFKSQDKFLTDTQMEMKCFTILERKQLSENFVLLSIDPGTNI